MTSTKLPPDMVLATPIGGKDVDPELEKKIKDKIMVPWEPPWGT